MAAFKRKQSVSSLNDPTNQLDSINFKLLKRSKGLPSLVVGAGLEEALAELDCPVMPSSNADNGHIRPLSTRSDEYNLFLCYSIQCKREKE